MQKGVETREDLRKAQNDKSAAKAAMDEATTVREKEVAVFAKESGDLRQVLLQLARPLQLLSKDSLVSFSRLKLPLS